MTNKYFPWALLFLSMTLCACHPTAISQPMSANAAPSTDPAEVKLSEAAASVSRSLIALAEIQQTVTPPSKKIQSLDASIYGMGNLVSINWSGPIEPLVEQIAKSTGYRIRVFGKSPAIPVMVALNEQNRPVGEILTNAGYQAGKQADIIVFPQSRIIELRYAATT